MSSESTEFLADGTFVDDAPVVEAVAPKTIALKLLLFAVLFLGSFSALYYFSEHFKPVEPSTMARALLIREEGERFEAIAVGNSHTGSVDFFALNLEGIYLWRGGSDYYQTNYILRTVQDKLPNLRFVFIPADISSYADNFSSKEKEEGGNPHLETYIFGGRVKGPAYLRLMRDGLPVQLDWKTLLQARFWPIARPDSWEEVLDRLRDPSKPPYPRTVSGSTGHLAGRSRERISPDSIAETAHQAAVVRLQNRRDLLEYRPTICELGETLMERIADATGPGVITVFFTHPTHPIYTEWFEEVDRGPDGAVECTPAYYAAVLDRERDDVMYFDMRRYEPVLSDLTSYFANGDHLNREGAMVFSAGLRDRLAERLRAEAPRGHPGRELVLAREADSLGHRYGAATGQDTLFRPWRRGGEVGD